MKRASMLLAVLTVAACTEVSAPALEGDPRSPAMSAKPAPPPSTSVPTSTTISAGFSGLVSDGRGAYTNGQSGVTSILRPDFDDHALEVKSRGQKPPRSFTVGLNAPVPGSGAMALGSIQTVDGLIQLEGLPSMAVGETKVLSRTMIYFWPPAANADQFRLGAPSGAGFLQATRLSATDWRVFTVPDSTAALYRMTPTGASYQVYVGNYNVPMELTIQLN